MAAAPAPASGAPAAAARTGDAWDDDDDDEPTVQTLSPPVTGGPGNTGKMPAAPSPDAPARPTGDRSSTTPTNVDAVLAARATTAAHSAEALASLPSVVDLEAAIALLDGGAVTDLHLAAGRPALARVGGKLVARSKPVAAEDVERIARGVIPARLESRLAMQGSCTFALAARRRLRATVSRDHAGYRLTLRVLHREPTLASLGLPRELERVAAYASGLVLFTGPAGHGKTTTLAAVVDALGRAADVRVATFEDPIEYVHEGLRAVVTQRELGVHVHDYYAGRRAALRGDVDVVVLGEIACASSARFAVSAAEAGKLVVATMCAPSAARATEQLIELFPRADQNAARVAVANALRMVVGQRLVAGVDGTSTHAAVEILPASSAIAALVREGRSSQIPETRGRAAQAPRLDDALAALVHGQKVTLAAARAACESTAGLDEALARLTVTRSS